MGVSVFPAASSGPTLAEITTAITNNAVTQTTWTLLGSVIADPGTSSITISGIPTTYKSLRVEVVGVIPSANDVLALRYNNDSTGVYSWHKNYSFTSSNMASYSLGDNQQRFNGGANHRTGQRIMSSTIIENYSNATERSKFWKSTGGHQDANIETNFVNDFGVYRPTSASAITSVTLFFISGATMSGFGVNGQSGLFVYGGN